MDSISMYVEMHNFIKVWSTAILSQVYCYYVVSRIPTAHVLTRLASLVPVFYLLTVLPLTLSSFHLGAPTVFYLVWLANFKLLLFSFNLGPLTPQPPLSLPHFIAVALLPVKRNDQQPPTNNLNKTTTTTKRHSKLTPEQLMRLRRRFKIVRFTIKQTILVTVMSLYRYRPHLHPYFILGLYCTHMYLGTEFLLFITALPVRTLLGLQLARQFNEPYLATSLQDFWGRRWNLMVTNILRQLVYDPVRRILTPTLGRNCGLVLATMATFLVSGLMHEVLFLYLSRQTPTWEVTWFFVLLGACVTLEMYIKKAAAGRWRLNRTYLSGLLTVGIVGVTSAWLFFPPLVRYGLDLKAIQEYYDFLSFIRNRLSLLS